MEQQRMNEALLAGSGTTENMCECSVVLRPLTIKVEHVETVRAMLFKVEEILAAQPLHR